jgi:hypothetical protein
VYEFNETLGDYVTHELSEIAATEKEGLVDSTKLLSFGEALPFRLGLRRIQAVHQTGESIFELILVDPKEQKLFKTKAQAAEEQADAEQERADAAEERVRELERTLNKM